MDIFAVCRPGNTTQKQVVKINYNKCKTCKNGACVNRLNPDSKPDRIAALCNRTCLCELEENKVIGNTFENSFRQTELWAIGREE